MAIKLEERRRFPRITLRTALRFQLRGTPEFNNTLSNDVSLGGISFVADKFIPLQASVGLEINVLSQILNPIGRIAWVVPLPHSYRYNVGIEFLELDPREKNYLKNYIDMRMNKL